MRHAPLSIVDALWCLFDCYSYFVLPFSSYFYETSNTRVQEKYNVIVGSTSFNLASLFTFVIRAIFFSLKWSTFKDGLFSGSQKDIISGQVIEIVSSSISLKL